MVVAVFTIETELLQSSNIWNFFRNQSQSKWSPVVTILSLSAPPPGQHQTKLRGSVALVLYLIRSITFAQINGECNTCLYYEVLPDIEGLNNTLPSICRCHPTLSAPVIKIAIWRRTKAWRISHLNRIPFSIIHSRASSFQLWKPRGKWNEQRVELYGLQSYGNDTSRRPFNRAMETCKTRCLCGSIV